jgi:hypothetical protein
MRTTSYSIALLLVGACAPTHVATTPAPTPIAGSRIRYSVPPDTARFVAARLVSLDAGSVRFERFVPGLAGQPGRRVVTSLATDSIARLQVHVGRRANVGRGVLIGGLAGVALGSLCASESEGSWAVTPEACFVGYAISGTLTGLVAGALMRSDVWAPATLPRRPPPQAALMSVEFRAGFQPAAGPASP